MPSVPWRVEFSKIFKKIFFKIPKMPKIVPKSIQTCFERVLGQTFRKFFAQFSTAFRILEKFQKNQKKISKFQKRPKSFPKESKRVLIVIWDNFFEKFLPSFPWKVKSSKIFKKIKKDSNFLKCPKSFPKVSKRVLDVFGANFRKIFCSVFRGGSSFRKISIFFFKIPKMPKSVPKSIQTCFEHVLGQTFRKIFAQFSMECRVFENFQKFFFQNSKNAQKCSQKNPNVF